MFRFATLALAGIGLIASQSAADAACPARLGVAYGDTLASIARACGVNVEALRMANPGLTAANLQAGTYISVPRPALPSPQIEIGRSLIRVTPPLVPPAVGGASPTVILPPEPLPIPRQHILPGFGDKPGQLPLPPGHAPLTP